MVGNDIQQLKVGASYLYTPDFSGDVPSDVTITGIAFTSTPSGTGALVLTSQTNDLANSRASILASGSAHGAHYVLLAVATLSNGEVLPKSISIQGFNG